MRTELKLRIRNPFEVSDVHKFHSVSHLVFHGGMIQAPLKLYESLRFCLINWKYCSFLPRLVPIKFVMFQSKAVWKYERNNGTYFPKFTWLEDEQSSFCSSKNVSSRKTSPFSLDLLELIQKPSSTRKAIKRYFNRSSTQWMKYMAIGKLKVAFQSTKVAVWSRCGEGELL